jgi:3'(2'), 5'-bisphosphate nucleotidase
MTTLSSTTLSTAAPLSTFTLELQVAIAACRQAAQLCQAVREQEISPEAIAKADKSPVTVADYGAQAIICKALREAFPADPVVAEEDADALRSPELADQLTKATTYVQALLPEATDAAVVEWISHGTAQQGGDRFWTLDPIDGTKGFLRGGQYAVALALIEAGQVKVGVLVCPEFELDGSKGAIFAAVRGQGATVQPLAGGNVWPIQVAAADHVAALRFVESLEHGDKEQQARLAQAVGITQESIRMDSQAKYGAVALGQAALYLRLPSPKTPNYREKIWDHAAGVLLVEEAGGQVSDRDGHPLDFTQGRQLTHNQGVIVSNGHLHQPILAGILQPA